MFNKLPDVAQRFIPPALLFAALSTVAGVAAHDAVEHSARGGVAGRAAAAADVAMADYVSQMSQDLDAGKPAAAEKANKKMEAARGDSTAHHADVDANHRTESRENSIAAAFSALAVGEVVWAGFGTRGGRKRRH